MKPKRKRRPFLSRSKIKAQDIVRFIVVFLASIMIVDFIFLLKYAIFFSIRLSLGKKKNSSYPFYNEFVGPFYYHDIMCSYFRKKCFEAEKRRGLVCRWRHLNVVPSVACVLKDRDVKTGERLPSVF